MGVKCAAGSAALGVNTAKTHKKNLTVQIPLLCPSRCWSAFGTLPFYCEHGDVPKSVTKRLEDKREELGCRWRL